MFGILITTTIIGLATYYNPGVMDTVRANRNLECTDCIGYVATLDCNALGSLVWLQRPGYNSEGPYMISDCAHSKHASNLSARAWVVDVDWETAVRWDMHAPIENVKVITESEYKHMSTIARPINHGVIK